MRSLDSSSEEHWPRVGSLDIDWRFLLPPPREGEYGRLLLLGATPEIAAKVEAVGVAREVLVAPSGRMADAVISLAAARLTLREAATHVDVGGILYYEADGGARVRLGTAPGQLLASLRRLKLSPTGLYWVHPSFTGPRTFFPLDVAGALGWYVRTLHSASSPFAVIDGGLERLAGVHPMRLGRFAPRLAVVAVAGPPPEVPPLPVHGPELPRSLHDPRLRPLLLIHGNDLTRAVMLPFAPTSPEPLAVLKIKRVTEDDGGPREPAILEGIRSALDEQMRATIPEPLGVVSSHGFVTSMESFLPGQWLHARLSRRRLPPREAIDDLELATAWITDLHARFPVGARRWGKSDVNRYVARPIEEFVAELGATRAESRLFDELRRRAADLEATALPIVWQHGDFSNLNVLRSGRRIHVVDWEWAAPGIPLDDVLHFARLWLYLARKADRPGSFTAFRDLFLRPGHHDPFVDAARAAIVRYMRRLDLDPRFLPLLLAAGCIRRARQRVEGRTILAGRPADPRERNRYVTYIGLIAEDSESFFEPAEDLRAWSPSA